MADNRSFAFLVVLYLCFSGLPTVAADWPAAGPNRVDEIASRAVIAGNSSPSVGSWFWGVVCGGAAVGVVWAVLARAARPQLTVEQLPLAVLDALATESELTGPQAHMITARLQALGPEELERILIARLLCRMDDAGGSLQLNEAELLDPGRVAIVKAYADGLLIMEERALAVSAEGRRFLGDFGASEENWCWVRFVEDRLEESLLVYCPTCGTELVGRWLRPSLGCPTCHHRFSIHDSSTVIVRSMPQKRFER